MMKKPFAPNWQPTEQGREFASMLSAFEFLVDEAPVETFDHEARMNLTTLRMVLTALNQHCNPELSDSPMPYDVIVKNYCYDSEDITAVVQAYGRLLAAAYPSAGKLTEVGHKAVILLSDYVLSALNDCH